MASMLVIDSERVKHVRNDSVAIINRNDLKKKIAVVENFVSYFYLSYNVNKHVL